jgi:hypothetical protein
MKFGRVTCVAIGVAAVGMTVVAAQQNQKPTVEIPKPGVPQIMTIEGEYVRIAYNNEGFVTLGYRVVNESIGQEWALLEIGATVRSGVPNYMLKREALSVETPDGKTIPLATNDEFLSQNLDALKNRANVMRDSINYFPPGASQACRIGFFAELGATARDWDQVELSPRRACAGRIYFRIPGGIKHGQHWLNVKFANSLVRVPFRVFTDEEKKTIRKNYGDIKKQVEEAMKQK